MYRECCDEYGWECSEVEESTDTIGASMNMSVNLRVSNWVIYLYGHLK